MEILQEEQFQEIKEKVRKVFNCSVERGGNTEIVVDVIGYGLSFTISEDKKINEGEAVEQPILNKNEMKVIGVARKYIKSVIKDVIKKN